MPYTKSIYPIDWDELSKQVKKEAGWMCVRCGHPDDPEACTALGVRRGRLPCTHKCTHPANGKQRMLTVHHLNGNKSDCRWYNLVSLCQVCHLHIQSKVVMERPWMFDHSTWFRPHVAGYYAYQNGLPHDREYVMAHLEELLEFGKPQVAT